MQTLRRKSAAGLARPYIKLAADAGLALSWDYYEAMLPQDGFSLLGLACSDCLMGPCRINPFDKGDGRGVCGLGRDGMTLRALRHAAGLCAGDDADAEAGVAQAFCDAADAMPDARPERRKIRAGLGVLAADAVNIALCGVDAAFAADLMSCAREHEHMARAAGAGRFNVVSVGGLYASLGIDAACGSGDAEAAVLTGLVDACVMGAGYPCRARALAGIAHTAFEASPRDGGLTGLLERACAAFARRGEATPGADIFTLETTVLPPEGLKDCAGVCVVGGGQNIKHEQQALLLMADKALREAGILPVYMGDAAVSLVTAGGPQDALAVEDTVVRALADMLASKGAGRGAAFFPSLCTKEDVRAAMALSAAAPVIYCSRLPIEGSAQVSAQVARRMEYAAPGAALERLLSLFAGA